MRHRTIPYIEAKLCERCETLDVRVRPGHAVSCAERDAINRKVLEWLK